MEKLTLKDATKEELIQYFFSPERVGGGFRIQADKEKDKEKFLLWLQQKRTGELRETYEACIEESQKAIDEYLSYIRHAQAEKDFEKKIDILSRANEAHERYETINKRIESIEKKLN